MSPLRQAHLGELSTGGHPSNCCYVNYFMEPVAFPPGWSKGASCHSEPPITSATPKHERVKRSLSRPPAQRWFFWGFPQTPAPSTDSGQAPGQRPFGNPGKEPYFHTNEIAGKLASLPTPLKGNATVEPGRQHSHNIVAAFNSIWAALMPHPGITLLIPSSPDAASGRIEGSLSKDGANRSHTRLVDFVHAGQKTPRKGHVIFSRRLPMFVIF